MATSWLTRSWKFLVVRGVLALVFGIVAMLWPLSTVKALAILWGVWALVDGISSLAQAFNSQCGRPSGSGREMAVLREVQEGLRWSQPR